jgi:hypothetical protein
MTHLDARWFDSVDNRWYELNRSSSNVAIRITCNDTNIIIQAVGTDWSTRTSGTVVTLEYTKTTD